LSDARLSTEATGVEQAVASLVPLLAQNPHEVLARVAELRQQFPKSPAVRLMEGLAYRGLRDPQRALSVFEALSGDHPTYATGWFELGRQLGGQWQLAQRALSRSRAIGFNQPEVHRLLGICYRHLNNEEASHQAFADYRQTILHDREWQSIQSARQQADMGRVEQLVKLRLKRSYDDPLSLALLAELATNAERYPQAIELLTHALMLDPNFSGARHQLAYVYLQAQRFDEAAQEVEALLKIDPTHLGYQFLNAGVMASRGDYQAAKVCFTSALVRDPKHVAGWLGLGHVLRTLGEFEACVNAYRKALHYDPHSGEAYFSLANLKTFKFEADDENAMFALLKEGIPEAELVNVEFALGKWFEDQKNFSRAFEFYQSANQRRKRLIPYDRQMHRAFIDRLIEFYQSPIQPRSQLESGGVIFIVGLPRAGSTLLEQILSSHSAIEGTMELPILPRIVRDLVGDRDADDSPRYPAVLAQLSEEDYRSLGQRYLRDAQHYRHTDRPWFVDKMPNNFTHIGLIQRMLPTAKVIDIRRHPMASCFSNFKQHFARGQSFTYDLMDLAHYYQDYVRWMRHVDRVVPHLVHRVIYEDLVESPEAVIRGLLEFVGVPFEASCLNFHLNDRAVRTASAQQVREPLNRRGLDHWQHFEADLGVLRTALAELLTPPNGALGWRG